MLLFPLRLGTEWVEGFVKPEICHKTAQQLIKQAKTDILAGDGKERCLVICVALTLTGLFFFSTLASEPLHFLLACL